MTNVKKKGFFCLAAFVILLGSPWSSRAAGDIPLDPAQTRIVVSEQNRELGERLQEAIALQTGQDIPMLADDVASEPEWGRYHLIALGNLSSNAVVARAYADHKVFVDAVFPGDDGHFVKTIVDPFGQGRHLIVAGGSDREGTRRSVDRLIEKLGTVSDRLPPVHSIQSPLLDIRTPPAEDVEKLIRGEIDLFADSRGTSALNRVMNAGMNYYFTNDPVWIELFKGPLMYFIERAREDNDNWFFAPRLSFYFVLGPIIETWSLIEQSPHITDAERNTLIEAFYDMGGYLSRSTYLPAKRSPVGEPRQNHPTFATLSLDAAARYFERRGKDVREWREITDRIFDGQMRSYRSDDDAGHYSWYSPIHAFVYYMRRDPARVTEGDMMGRLGRLGIMLMNNRREEIMFGDKRTYQSWDDMPWARYLGPVFSNTYYATRDPAFAWAYQYVTEGQTPPAGIQRPLNNMLYTVPMPEDLQPPVQYLGVTSLLLDEAPLQWAASRVREQSWIPDRNSSYVDKLTMRPSFDPADEYLVLDGTSAFSHGHEDANSILQLTWKDRIWLESMDYVRAMPRFQNSIEIAREGRTSISPPFSLLEAEADFESLGITRMTLADYNGLDWSRNVIWRKGSYMVVLDELTAGEGGDYDLQCRWSVLGDPQLDGRTLHVTQQGADFRMINADHSRPSVYLAPPGQSEWEAYEYAGPDKHVFHQRLQPTLAPGESAHFMNLFYARGDGEDTVWHFGRVEEGLSAISGEDGPALAGLARSPRMLADATLQADAFFIDRDGLSAVNLTLLETGFMSLVSNRPVTISGPESRLTVHTPTQLRLGGTLVLDGVQGEPAGEMTTYHLAPGEYSMELEPVLDAAALARLAGRAVEPAAGRPEEPIGFSISREWSRRLDSPVSAVEADPRRADAWWLGLEDGQILHLQPDGSLTSVGQLADGVQTILYDARGDRPLLIAGDKAAAVTAFDPGGTRVWQQQLGSNRGRTERIVSIQPLNKEGQPRLVVATEASRVHVFELSGRLDWMEAFKYHAATQLIVTDISGDGAEDIVIGNEYHTPIYVFDSEGNELWMAWEQVGSESRSTTRYLGTNARSLAVATLAPEYGRSLVLGTETDDVFNIRPDGRQVHWHANVGGEAQQMLIADVSGDQRQEVIVGTGSGYLQALDSSGERLWWRGFDSPITSLSSLWPEGIDLLPILAFSTGDGRAGLLDPEGQLVGLTWLDAPVSHLKAAGESGGLLAFTRDGRITRLTWHPPRAVYGPQFRSSRHRY